MSCRSFWTEFNNTIERKSCIFTLPEMAIGFGTNVGGVRKTEAVYLPSPPYGAMFAEYTSTPTQLLEEDGPYETVRGGWIQPEGDPYIQIERTLGEPSLSFPFFYTITSVLAEPYEYLRSSRFNVVAIGDVPEGSVTTAGSGARSVKVDFSYWDGATWSAWYEPTPGGEMNEMGKDDERFFISGDLSLVGIVQNAKMRIRGEGGLFRVAVIPIANPVSDPNYQHFPYRYGEVRNGEVVY